MFDQGFPICERLQQERQFGGVLPKYVLEILPHYKDWIMAAAEQGHGDWGKIVERLETGDYQLWITPSSALVTCLRIEGAQNVCVLLHMGGSLEDARECLPGIMEWARANGCVELVIEGRKGWQRALADFNPKLRYCVYAIGLGA